MSEFLGMGGYAPYVWTAYGITLLTLALNAWWVRRLYRRNLARARTAFTAAEGAKRATVRQIQ